VSDTDTTDETTAVDNTEDDAPVGDADMGQTPTTDAAEENNDEDQGDDADTFPRSYVERLRR
jgi:hypothetical protein